MLDVTCEELSLFDMARPIENVKPVTTTTPRSFTTTFTTTRLITTTLRPTTTTPRLLTTTSTMTTPRLLTTTSTMTTPRPITTTLRLITTTPSSMTEGTVEPWTHLPSSMTEGTVEPWTHSPSSMTESTVEPWTHLPSPMTEGTLEPWLTNYTSTDLDIPENNLTNIDFINETINNSSFEKRPTSSALFLVKHIEIVQMIVFSLAIFFVAVFWGFISYEMFVAFRFCYKLNNKNEPIYATISKKCKSKSKKTVDEKNVETDNIQSSVPFEPRPISPTLPALSFSDRISKLEFFF